MRATTESGEAIRPAVSEEFVVRLATALVHLLLCTLRRHQGGLRVDVPLAA